MRTKFQWVRLLLACGLLSSFWPSMAEAHPGHGVGVMGGMMHPLTGIDHMMGLLAIGIWAARNGSKLYRLLVPMAFLGGMIVGGVMGIEHMAPYFLESALIMTLIATGVLFVLSVRLPIYLQLLVAVFFALWHGLAHGAEIPSMVEPWAFIVGFVISSAMLLAVGVALGLTVFNTRVRERWIGVTLIAGAFFVFGGA